MLRFTLSLHEEATTKLISLPFFLAVLESWPFKIATFLKLLKTNGWRESTCGFMRGVLLTAGKNAPSSALSSDLLANHPGELDFLRRK
jgi:hypothetical protein